MSRSWVPLATDVTQGYVLPTVASPGPVLPALVATNTPALAARRNARPVAFTYVDPLPEIE